MTAKSNAFQPKIPDQWTRLRTLDSLGAPTFHMLPCAACGAEPPYECFNLRAGQHAHQSRIDSALRIAYGQET